MNGKKFNIILIVLIIISIFIVTITNYYIDPFNVFHTKNRFNIVKPCLTKNMRLSIIPSLKLNKDKIDAVWIGSSRTGWGENEVYDEYLTGKKFLNLAINGVEFDETLDMAYNAILIHPEIKEIYYGIDFSFLSKSYSKTDEAITRQTSSKIKKEEILPLLLSGKVFLYSFETVTANIGHNVMPNLPKDVVIKTYGTETQYNQDIDRVFNKNINLYFNESYKNYKLDLDKLQKLKEFIEYANKKDVKVIIFVTSMHSTERILIEETGNLESFYTFKKEMAKIQPYYDFALINKYTTDEIKPEMQYFRDMIHTYPFIRKKVSNQIFLGNEDFGTFITEENADEIIKKDKIEFKKYVEKNESLKERIKEQIR